MHPEKMASIKIFAVGVYFALIGILIYFMMFNFGLSIEASPSTVSDEILLGLKNGSMHTIRDAKLSYIDTDGELKEILTVDTLKPGEVVQTEFIIPAYMLDMVDLVAEAPNHIKFTKEIGFVGKKGASLTYEHRLISPIIAVGKIIQLDIEICNMGNAMAEEVILTATHDESALEGEETEENFSLRAGECKKIYIALETIKTGDTQIDYDIVSENYNKSEKLRIEVIENV